jgi:hypothetical protein
MFDRIELDSKICQHQKVNSEKFTKNRLKKEAESLEEEIENFERIDYSNHSLLKEYHNIEIEILI